MTVLHAPEALLPSGWARDVRVEVDEAGTIVSVTPQAPAAAAARLPGPVLPGLVDVHCHAFQRAMAGLTEHVARHADTFWTWREVMYSFLARLTPEDVEAVAAQLYVELLKGG
jgi:formimidoylglutamate deiminase